MEQRMSNREMEELQLSIEERLYGLSLVKLGEVLEFLELNIVEGESRAQTLRKIGKFIKEKMDTGGEIEALLLDLQAVIGGRRRQEETEGEDAEIEDLKMKFQKILDTQWKEVEQRYHQQTGGKKVAAHESDAAISSKNIIRIKDFKITGVISSEKNRLAYSSLNKQIDSALKRGYPENDIIDGVISAIAPSLH